MKAIIGGNTVSMLLEIELEKALAGIDALTLKQAVLREKVNTSSQPDILIQLGETVRELSELNCRIAELIRRKSQRDRMKYVRMAA